MEKENNKSEHKVIKTIYRLLLPVVGVACIVAPGKVVIWLPAVLGSIMILTGAVDIFFSLKNKKYLDKQERYEKKASSLILATMGVCFLLGGGKTVLLMGITWGLLGLQEVNEELKNILLNKSEKKPWKMKAVCAALKFVLSLALIFEPLEKFSFHIMLLGLEIIVVTLKGSDVAEYMKELRLKFKG